MQRYKMDVSRVKNITDVPASLWAEFGDTDTTGYRKIEPPPPRLDSSPPTQMHGTASFGFSFDFGGDTL